jgi:hypothetical protein
MTATAVIWLADRAETEDRFSIHRCAALDIDGTNCLDGDRIRVCYEATAPGTALLWTQGSSTSRISVTGLRFASYLVV